MSIMYIFDKTKSEFTNYSLKNPQLIVSLCSVFSKNQNINRAYLSSLTRLRLFTFSTHI